tara:strand:+ start:519 stop:1088 length:570 start_codon:yes stop_codon:yes gene_type:complete
MQKNISSEKRQFKDFNKQLLFNDVEKNYTVFNDSIIIKDDIGKIIVIFIKGFYNIQEYTLLENFILSENLPKKHKLEFSIDTNHKLYPLITKVLNYNQQYNNELNMFDTLHIFNNHVVDIHQDSTERMIKNLFIIKHDEIDSLTVFPEYEMAFDIQNGDCLFFDTSLWHYACTNKMISSKKFRYAMYFE